jgi:23S rRNA (pseudouridine1915-N3)-methyltransferase
LRLHILAIGKMKAGPERALTLDYLDRARKLGRSAGITAIDVSEGLERGLAHEAEWLLARRPAGAFTVVLDERGETHGSPAFAALIAAKRDQGQPAMAFLVGGPDGHGAAALEAAHLRLSLGAMTWPHRLARALIAEQIYRAVTIMVNHPYHRP